jgi:hypothetical protein
MWRRRVTVDRLVKAVEIGDITLDDIAMVFNRFQPTSVKPPSLQQVPRAGLGSFHPYRGSHEGP